MEANSLEQEGKVPVVNTDRYTLYLEHFDDHTFIHCDVYKWNKTTKKEMQRALDLILDEVDTLYALRNVERDNEPTEKFLKMYGFNYFKTIECLDGIDRPMWIKQRGNK
jgi:hypothetical protein